MELTGELQKGGYKKVKAIKEPGHLHYPVAMKYLIPLLNDETILIKVNTINAIDSIGSPEAINHLKKLLDNKNKEIKFKALNAIKNLEIVINKILYTKNTF